MLDYTILDYGDTFCSKDWNSPGNTINYYKIYYCLEGSALYRSHDNFFLLKPGFLYILPQKTDYEVVHTQELLFHVLWFHADTIFPMVNSLYEIKITPGSLPDTLLLSLKLSIIDNPELLGTLLSVLFSALNIPGIYELGHSQAVTDCIAYIHQHISDPITNDTLSTLSGYNKRYFIRLFKEQTGLTPRQYVIHTKFNYAKKYLAEKKSVTECAHLIGYENVSAFSRDFKALFSTTPGNYCKHPEQRP